MASYWVRAGERGEKGTFTQMENQEVISLVTAKKTHFSLSSQVLFSICRALYTAVTVFLSEAYTAVPQVVLGKPLTDVRFTQWVVFIYVFLKSNILGESLGGIHSIRSTSNRSSMLEVPRVKSIVFRD